MSAIASFFQLPLSAVDGLRRASQGSGHCPFLKENGVEVADYKWSGFVFATLLCFLQERDVDLMKSEWDELSSALTQTSGATHFIFTAEHKSKYLEPLDPQRYNEADLRDYYNDFNGCNEEQIGKAMLDGIKTLQQSLASLPDGHIIVFMIT